MLREIARTRSRSPSREALLARARALASSYHPQKFAFIDHGNAERAGFLEF
jgi:hypothetical protein